MHSNAMAPTETTYDEVTVRWAKPRDAEAIRRVAGRDSKLSPAGATLVAEVAGEIAAALAIDGGETIADPFRPTSDLVDMLELRAAQIAAHGQAKGRGVASLWLARHFLTGGRDTSAATARPGLAGR